MLDRLTGNDARPRAAVAIAFAAILSLILLLGAPPPLPSAPAAQAAGALTLTPFLTGLTEPIYAAQPPDGTNRFFVVERGGLIKVAVNGVMQATPFLDVRSLITFANSAEQGLLGLAFHPQFASNGLFFIYYTAAGGSPAGANTLARYRVSSTDPNRADPASRLVLFSEQDQRQFHNGGMLAFGPDGYLYVAMGDDGTGLRSSPDASNLGSLFGKLLRLDVNSASPYAIPPSNPFVGRAGARGEIWALGLRNPWRFSFDRATGDLWIGDVGQEGWEEINRQPAGFAGGANYQWPCMEGFHPYNTSAVCNQGISTPPIFEYARGGGSCVAITGGYVYRGAAMPGYVGAFFYGDYCLRRIWALRSAAGGTWTSTLLSEGASWPASFVEDRAGELYVADIFGGAILRMGEAGVPTPTPTRTSTPPPPTATPTRTPTAPSPPTATPTPPPPAPRRHQPQPPPRALIRSGSTSTACRSRWRC